MAKDNITQFRPQSLFVYSKTLMDFDRLNFAEQHVLDSLYIFPPDGWTVFGPEGDLFEHPIQITILGIEGDRVKLGIYKHPSLLLTKGPLPDTEWQRTWKQGTDYSANTLPPLHTGEIAAGFAILGDTLYIDDLRVFDDFLGVPADLLSDYAPPAINSRLLGSYSTHPDFYYEILEADNGSQEPRKAVEIEIDIPSRKNKYIVSVVRTVSDYEPLPRSVVIAEEYLPEYARKLKDLMDTYQISDIELTFRWID